MIGTIEKQNVYLSSFDSRIGACPPAVRPLRTAAIERFARLGFPTTRMEAWKYTSLAELAKIPFKPAAAEHKVLDRPTFEMMPLEKMPLSGLDSIKLVFVNGRFDGRLSSAIPSGLGIGSLAEGLSSGPPNLQAHLGRHASYEDNGLVALSTAFIEDGAFIDIPSGSVLAKPIQLLFVSTGDAEQPVVTHPRILVVTGHNVEATVIETYVGLTGGLYFTNSVSEIVVGENSIVDHYKVQKESEGSFHLATIQVSQDRSSIFCSHSFSLGGGLVRNDVNVVLDGEGAECTLDGLYLETADQHVDNHTLIDHAKSHCSSRELYKGILDGKSTGVFNGSVIVRKDAQKTDARQTNKNLLLSGTAEINTKPQLEIYADDVKCSHGATIGQLDQESIFYLRSRGIPYDEARKLLTYAFSNEILLRIKDEQLRAELEKTVFSALKVG
jgi:Fe-S cluster assembly protein SufD